VREEIFAGSTWHAAYEPQRAIRTRRHKYIRRWGDRLHAGAREHRRRAEQGPAAAQRLGEREIPKEQLYDLVFDPNEANNLVEDPAYAAVLAELRARLEHLDARHRRSAARRPRRPAAGRRNQPPRPALGERTDGPDRVSGSSERSSVDDACTVVRRSPRPGTITGISRPERRRGRRRRCGCCSASWRRRRAGGALVFGGPTRARDPRCGSARCSRRPTSIRAARAATI
jgi:hypothetical protein